MHDFMGYLCYFKGLLGLRSSFEFYHYEVFLFFISIKKCIFWEEMIQFDVFNGNKHDN